jgi:hypothetical protein
VAALPPTPALSRAQWKRRRASGPRLRMSLYVN